MTKTSHHPEMKENHIFQHAPLNNRDVLYWGSNPGYVSSLRDREREAIHYYDVMSRYLYVFKYFKFLVGKPKIHVGDLCRDNQAMLSKESLIKFTVLRPKILYHAVLPFRCNNNLLFIPCCTCAIECNFSGKCVHESIAQKFLKSTWFLDEFRLAIEKVTRSSIFCRCTNMK